MDWLQIIYNCIIIIIGVVIFGIGLYLIVAIPVMIITLAVGTVWSFFRLFLPFLPSFWDNIGTSSSPRKGFDWGEKTEADKHRDLVEHIRIQQMNEERNRR